MNVRTLLALAITMLSLSWIMPSGAEAKHQWTITQREEALNKEVNAGQKANELTLKEANGIRDDLAGVTSDIAKAKAKNGGKLSYKDEGKIEKKLNSISVDIQKKKLQKRVTSR
jgi:hypothetical protein